MKKLIALVLCIVSLLTITISLTACNPFGSNKKDEFTIIGDVVPKPSHNYTVLKETERYYVFEVEESDRNYF